MLILGLNAYHPDASAVVLADGVPVAAIEEERLRRIKHWTGFPELAIASVLEVAGIRAPDLDHIAVGRNPRAHRLRKGLYALTHPRVGFIADRLRHRGAVLGIRDRLARALGTSKSELPPVHWIEHHVAHLASTFHCSPYDEAAVCTLDAFGDFVSTSTAIGRNRRLFNVERVHFPHSLGIFYSALTQYLGFPEYGDEFKVMGLAAYGRPSRAGELHRLIRLQPGGSFELDLSFFRHATGAFTWSWGDGAPDVSRLFSHRLESLLGNARAPGEPLEDRHADIAASLQAVYSEAVWHVLHALSARSRTTNICLAGGCALNSVANGRIAEHTSFREVFVQPAAGDAGTALGAALNVHHQIAGKSGGFTMKHAFLGPAHEYPADKIAAALPANVAATTFENDEEVTAFVAGRLAEGCIVGWYEGRMEWGPRALGNRSILADPRRAEMRDYINRKIKYREPFRPFAISVLAEHAERFIVPPSNDPFMVMVRPVHEGIRSEIPAAVHIDGTTRIQTVDRDVQPLFHALISHFARLTGVPVLLNTSFNESEPIVDTPDQALSCFLRTGMDVLAIGHTVFVRAHQPEISAGAGVEQPAG